MNNFALEKYNIFSIKFKLAEWEDRSSYGTRVCDLWVGYRGRHKHAICDYQNQLEFNNDRVQTPIIHYLRAIRNIAKYFVVINILIWFIHMYRV